MNKVARYILLVITMSVFLFLTLWFIGLLWFVRYISRMPPWPFLLLFFAVVISLMVLMLWAVVMGKEHGAARVQPLLRIVNYLALALVLSPLFIVVGFFIVRLFIPAPEVYIRGAFIPFFGAPSLTAYILVHIGLMTFTAVTYAKVKIDKKRVEIVTTKIFETHAHYDHRQYNDDREAVLAKLADSEVGAVINIGCDMEASRASVALAERFDHFYATVGVHPHDAKTLTEPLLAELAALAQHKKVVAVGEIGLDFNRNFSPPEVQRKWFGRQLDMAAEAGLPVVIHSRDADEEVFSILEASPHRRGVIHAFPGDVALAQRYAALGFYLGIGGILTYDKTGRLRAVVKEMPLECLLLETDCPFLTPVPHRGKRNESKYLTYIVATIAMIKEVSEEEVRAQTWANACTLFGIDR